MKMNIMHGLSLTLLAHENRKTALNKEQLGLNMLEHVSARVAFVTGLTLQLFCGALDAGLNQRSLHGGFAARRGCIQGPARLLNRDTQAASQCGPWCMRRSDTSRHIGLLGLLTEATRLLRKGVRGICRDIQPGRLANGAGVAQNLNIRQHDPSA